jgi:hypothetical protein
VCTPGHYCDVGVTAQVPCPPGFYCPGPLPLVITGSIRITDSKFNSTAPLLSTVPGANLQFFVFRLPSTFITPLTLKTGQSLTPLAKDLSITSAISSFSVDALGKFSVNNFVYSPNFTYVLLNYKNFNSGGQLPNPTTPQIYFMIDPNGSANQPITAPTNFNYNTTSLLLTSQAVCIISANNPKVNFLVSSTFNSGVY